jgi:hypothetical protein
MDNLKEFEAGVIKVSKKLTQEDLLLFQQKIALLALQRIVDKTPVDSGRARGNWQVTVGEPATTVLDAKTKTGVRSKQKGTTRILGVSKPFQIIWMANNLPYIEVLEDGGFIPPDPGVTSDQRKGRKGRILVQGGYSVQAPQGMVAVTISELLTIFN